MVETQTPDCNNKVCVGANVCCCKTVGSSRSKIFGCSSHQENHDTEILLSWLLRQLSSLFSPVFIMADSDSDLGFFPALVQRIRRRNSDLAREIDDSDEESLYETMPQKMMKMNKKKRIVRKGGLTNVTYKNISKKRRRYISDLYTTLLDSSWTYVVLLFASSFYGSWILFGGKNIFAPAISLIPNTHSLQSSTMSSASLTVTSLKSIFLKPTGNHAYQKLTGSQPSFSSPWKHNTPLATGPDRPPPTVLTPLCSCRSR